MFSNLKKVAMLSIIFAVLSAVAAVLIALFIFPMQELEFPFKLAILAFCGCTPITNLAFAFGLWGLQNDLELQNDTELEERINLQKRIEELEKKVN